MNISQLKEEIKSIVEGRGVKTIQKDYSQVLSDIEKALEFYKKNKDTDKKDAFVKVLKKLGEKKKKLAKELDDKVSGMYKNAEYQGESVNESDTLKQIKKGDSIILKRGNKIYATISQNPNKEYNWTVYFQKGPALSGYKTKKDAIARAQKMSDSLKGVLNKLKGESVVNEMTMGFDSMTGLFYLQGVPFTRERMKEVILFMKSSKAKSKVNQFEYTPALIVKDKVGKGEVIIDPKNLKILIEFYKKNSAKLASDKDF